MNMRLISFRFAPLFIVVAIFLASFQSAFALSEWHSINWAGYAAQRGYYTGVTATWTVPAVTLEDGEHGDSQWVGIGGVSTGDLIQVGTQSYMKDGELSYQAWYEMLPDYSTDAPLAVNAGDSVTATLSETSPGTWLIQITNNSTGGNFEKTVQYDSSHSSAEWVEEMMSNADATLRPLSRFGSVTFTNSYATDNGAQKSAGDESTRFYTMTDKAGNVITSVSPLSGDGTSFTASRSSYTVPQGMLSYLNIVPRTVTVSQTTTTTDVQPQAPAQTPPTPPAPVSSQQGPPNPFWPLQPYKTAAQTQTASAAASANTNTTGADEAAQIAALKQEIQILTAILKSLLKARGLSA